MILNISSENKNVSNVLGRGSYGIVIKRGNEAVKRFTSDDPGRESSLFNSFIRELCIIKYFNNSDYTVNLHSYNLREKEMVMELYDCTLKEYIIYNFTFEEKERIFINVVRGLLDLHSKDIIHSDIKLSNILINLDSLKVVLCDFGLSGVKNYAKMYNVAPVSRPDISFPGYEYTHDMFGLCVSFLQVFGDIQLKRNFILNMTRERLRKCINKVIDNYKVRKILLGCIKDNPEDIFTASDILRYYDGDYERYTPISIYMRREYRKIDYSHIKSIYLKISSEYGINMRRKLGCKLFSYIETSMCNMRNINYNRLFCLHVVVFTISCLCKRYQRGEEKLTKESILNKFPNRNEEDFYMYISYIIDNEVSLNILLGRKYIS